MYFQRGKCLSALKRQITPLVPAVRRETLNWSSERFLLTTYFKTPFGGERQREKNQMCPNAALSAEAGVKSNKQGAISGRRRLEGGMGGEGG